MSFSAENTVLTVFVRSATDLTYAVRDLWYRIPLLHAPADLLSGKIQTLAFCSREAGRLNIRYFGTVKDCQTLKRREILPLETSHPNADKDYCKVELADCHLLPQPILGTSGQWFLTLATTETKLFQARTVNDLFNASPLEETIYQVLQNQQLPCERQYQVLVDADTRFYLDFALFCRFGKINIECDGATYHSEDSDKDYDDLRDKILILLGWSVIRLPSQVIRYQVSEAIKLLADTIEDLGGLKNAGQVFRPFSADYGEAASLPPV